MKLFASTLLSLVILLPLAAYAQTSEITQTIDENGQYTTTETGTTTEGDAYQFQRQGIFDCNKLGGSVMSVGATSAIGGVYVPVADAAVELNTGILVYKECVLRELVDRERENALSNFFSMVYQAVQGGRDGNPLYVQNIGQELLDVSDNTFVYGFLKDGVTLNTLNTALIAPLTRALAQSYYAETRLPQNESLECSYQGNLNQWWSGEAGFSLSDFWDASQPQCNAVSAYYLAQNIGNSRVAQALQNQQTQWNWSRGYYAVTDNAQNPLAETILTPASVVQSSFQQLLNSPVTQLEGANDIGQMIGALYAGVTTQVISDTQGLAGLSRSAGGQPSYLDRLVSESAAGVRNAATNIALNVLNPVLVIEQALFAAFNSIASTLTNTIQGIRSAENQCWNLIIPKVCASTPDANNKCQAKAVLCTANGTGSATCTIGGTTKTVPTSSCIASGTGADGVVIYTCPTNTQLTIATSTVFSQAVINANIAPLASSTVTELKNSQAAITLVQELIAGVTNVSSLNAQRVAIQQLDTLVATGKLHTQNAVVEAQGRLANTQDAMATLAEDTVQNWADGSPNGSAFSGSNQTGWCNVSDTTDGQTTINTWISTWKQ